MFQEFLTPVISELQEFAQTTDWFSIGHNIRFDEEIAENSLVIFSVRETRGGSEDFNEELDFATFRKEFYQLKTGDWHLPIYDIGELHPGATREDTYFAFHKIQVELLKKNVNIIILGGATQLAYWQYRAFDVKTHQLNLAVIDNRFRLGVDQEELNSNNYLSKIISEEPHHLFEYTHLGHQTYFVAQEELDLMEHLNFDVKRLGKLTENLEEAEPELRNSDMLVLNLEAIQASDFQSTLDTSPNGLSAREICALTRYAGINNKLKSFGVYNFKAKNIPTDEMLLAELIWYFIEGKNLSKDAQLSDSESLTEKFHVQIPEQDLVFYHHLKTEQWWMEFKEITENDNDSIKIPCSKKDYETSLQGKIPDRWWKTYKKFY